jgi:hypothetical protein
MSTKQIFDVVENRIRLGIDKLGFHALFKDDLNKLWEQDGDDSLSLEEKTKMIKDYAASCGYQVRVTGNMTLAIFTLKEKVS